MRHRRNPSGPSGSSGPGLLRAARTWLTVPALCAAGGLAPGATSAQTAADSVALRARIEAYRTVWNTHDASALSAFFSDSADLVMGNQPEAVGRQAIRESWRDYFSNQEPERHLTLDVHSVRFVDPEVAVVHVTTTTGGRDREGRALLSRRFRGAWVVQRRSGEWLISAMRGEPTEQDRVVLNESLAAAEELRPGIRAFVDAYEDAFNSHVASAVSAFYADDADIIVRNGPVTHGRQAIQAWWQSYFVESRPYRAIYIVKDIRSVTPDVALVNLVVTGAAVESTAEPAPVRYTRATWLLARDGEGARWLLSAVWVLPSEEDDIIREGVPPEQ
jgi:uncharacterized protein (TIGR02246 family)